ncbi:MAG: hypothetical protein JO353_05650 [Phycisphaerae bacterium]|nr:hypothetical protein [Phycisphaerae bacterium]
MAEMKVGPMQRVNILVIPADSISRDTVIDVTTKAAKEFSFLTPQLHGPYSNVQLKYNPATFSGDIDFGNSGFWMWEHRAPNASGNWAVDLKTGRGRHSFAIERQCITQAGAEALLEWYASELKLLFAQCVMLSSPEAEYAEARGYATAKTWRGRDCCLYHSPNVDDLAFGIPYLGWATVFGPAYCDFFGHERLLSCPAPVVREIAPSHILFQLTKDWNEIETDCPIYNRVRESVIDHLGRQHFNRVRTAEDPPERTFNHQRIVEVDESNVPPSLLPIRKENERAYARFPQSTDQMPPPIQTLDELLADEARFEITNIGSSRVIIDKQRKEMISLADNALSDEWISRLSAVKQAK